MTASRLRIAAGLALSCFAMLHAADVRTDLKPLLGERGDVIFFADFDAKDAAPFYVIDAGKSEVINGALRLAKKSAEEKHPGVAYLWRKEGPPPISNFIMQVDFQFDGGDGFGLEFKRPGKVIHGDPPEFFVFVRKAKDPQKPFSCSLVDNCPSSVIATQSFDLKPGQWGRLQIEVCRGEVAVQIENGPTLRGVCKLASSPKGSPQISVGSAGEKAVKFDNFKIWAVK